MDRALPSLPSMASSPLSETSSPTQSTSPKQPLGQSVINMGSEAGTPAASPCVSMDLDSDTTPIIVGSFEKSIRKNIATLRNEVATLSTRIINIPDGPEKDMLMSSCREKGELVRTLVGTLDEVNASNNRTVKQSNVVPNNLPLFQWDGCVSIPSAPVFSDVAACLQKFQDIMFCHNLDYNTNFLRLIPACLTSQRPWFDVFVSGYDMVNRAPTWSEFKVAMTEHYGLTVDEDRTAAGVELTEISMNRQETYDAFIDRFNGLRRRAVDQCPPNSVLISKFLNALPPGLQDRIAVSRSSLEKPKKENLEHVMGLVKELGKMKSKRGADANINTMAIEDNRDSKKSKWANFAAANASLHSSGVSKPHSIKPTSKSSRKNNGDLWCEFHKVHTHNTIDCRAASSASAALLAASSGSPPKPNYDKGKKPFGSCYKCGASPWKPGHKCNSAIRSDNTEHTSRYLGAMHISEVNSKLTITDSASSHSPVSSPTDMVIDEPNVDAFVAQQAQLCKYNNFSQLPQHKSNSILIPVILNNIKTFAIIDTGASFSIVSPFFVRSLGSSVVVSPSVGNIQLGHSQVKKPREGHCLLNIFYNKIKLLFKFEIFDFYSDVDNVPLLLGLDILPKLNIGITGLVSSWFSYTGPSLPSPIDPNDTKPNESPFGSPKERQLMMSIIQPLLASNANISLKNTYCNLPGSIVRLETEPGRTAYRKPYPLPEAYRSAVLAQIDTWQDEGVVELAQCHTGFNSPLLCVSKKDDDGVYSFKKPRVVADVRLLNSILLSTDKFQLPIISDIHQKLVSLLLLSIVTN
ncbi:hypothetical protein BDB01DRAFT_857440 [Pilobolus umbonatus]|nr:hypothetical protein BDB01DRAFT_857440 [Pilobolus umbonatus]